MKIGSHCSFSKGDKYLIGVNKFANEIKANAMMIYLGAPQSFHRAPIEEYNLEEFKKISHINTEDIVIHAPYIINPASIEKYQFSIDLLVEDCKRMNYIGAKYLVLHPGAHTKFKREESIERLVQTLKEIINKTKDVVICLETMAGKGTELANTFEELRLIIDKVNSDRIGVCLDTCHVWDAGYNVKDYQKLISELKKNNLLTLVKVLHINDSKNNIGARKDRHENIGKGYIGLEPLKKIVNGKEFKDAIKILETPYVDKKPIYKEEIQMLK